MKKKHLLSTSYSAVIVLLVMTCISCAHQHTNFAAADGEEGADQHVWADTKEVGEAIAKEESSQESTPAADLTAEAVAVNKDLAATEEAKPVAEGEQKAAEDDMDKTLAMTESAEAPKAEESQVSDAVVPAMTVAKLDQPREDQAPVSESAVAQIAEPPAQKETQPAPETSSTESREVAEQPSSETNTESALNSEPTVGNPSSVKEEVKPVPHKAAHKRSSSSNTAKPTPVAPVVSSPVAPSTQAQVEKAKAPVTVAAKEMEESFGHEPIPAKPADEEDASEAQLASVEIANFIERHALIVLIGTVGFVIGLYFVMRRNKEHDNNI